MRRIELFLGLAALVAVVAGCHRAPTPVAGPGGGGVGGAGVTGIAVDHKTGTVYVAIGSKNVVEKFGQAGKMQGKLGGTGAGQITAPNGVAIGPDGSIVVSEASGQFLRFGPKGAFQVAGTTKGGSAAGVAVSPTSTIFVLDGSKGDIEVAGYGGKLQNVLSSVSLAGATSIAFGGSGAFYVAMPGKVQIVGLGGKDRGTLAGVTNPVAVGTDPKGLIYVLEANDVKVFGAAGAVRGTIPNVMGGTCITADAKGDSYVGTATSIMKFGAGHKKQGEWPVQ